MKKAKFKVGDRVELTTHGLELYFPNGTRFRKGVVEEVDLVGLIMVTRDDDGIPYRGHENKWWGSNHWRKVVSGFTPDERYDG